MKFYSCMGLSNYDAAEFFRDLDTLLLLVLLDIEPFLPNEYSFTNFLNYWLCKICNDNNLFYGSVLIIILKISYSKSEICYFENLIFFKLFGFLLLCRIASMLYPLMYVFLVALN